MPAHASSTAIEAGQAHFVLIEDDALVRDLLSKELAQRFAPRAVHAFGLGSEGLQHCLTQPADLLLVDLRLPDTDGRNIVRQLRARERLPRVIVLTSQVTPQLPAELVALGVAGYVDKGAPLEHAVRAVEAVLAGGMYFFASITPHATDTAAAGGPDASPSILSDRERDVVRLVARGLSSKEVARQLSLSPRTVDNYRANAMAKIGVRDAVSLVRWCLRHGLG